MRSTVPIVTIRPHYNYNNIMQGKMR